MTPEKIKDYAQGLRTKLERVRTTVGYESFRPLQDVFSVADDLCELVIALAENQKETQDALNPPPTDNIIESKKES